MARRSAAQPVYAAVPPQQQVKPAFTVQKLSGTVPHRVHIFDKERNKILAKTVHEPAGYLVKFYKGHSIRCRDEAHLRRVGVGLALVPLIDGEGEVKGVMPNIDLPQVPDEDDDVLELEDENADDQ